MKIMSSGIPNQCTRNPGTAARATPHGKNIANKQYAAMKENYLYVFAQMMREILPFVFLN